MADNDDDDSQNAVPELSPEERIAKLEKNRMINMILIGVLSLLVIVQLVGLGMLYMKPVDTTPQNNLVKLAEIDAKYIELQKLKDTSEKIIIQNNILDTKFNKILNSANIENYANMRTLLIEQEQSHLAFLEALQEGMRRLSSYVRGSRTWYEEYKEKIDKVIQDTKSRQARLENLDPGQ